VPVLVLAILDHSEPVLVSTSTRHSGAGFDRNSPFRWGSISKTVTALVLMESARRHGVELDTPVRELLEPLPYRNPWASGQPVRLAHLLELSAGLPELTAEEFDDNTPLPLDAALARGAHRRVLLWPPGLQHSYSNVPPGISAAVVEELTDAAFEQAAQRLVFDPLGMAPASFEQIPGLPGGYRADGSTRIPYWHMTFPAFGAMNASPAAMTRLLAALLNQGRLDGEQALAAESVARLFRMQASLGARHGLEVGYGAGVYGWVRDGHLFQGHGGDADGYRSRFGLLTQAGRGYLLGINVDDPALLRRMQRLTERALTADLDPPVPPEEITLPPTVLARYAGAYYPSSTRFGVDRWQAGEARRAHILIEAGGLVFQRGDRRQRLIPVAVDRFRRPGDPAVSVIFAEQDDVLYLQGELGNYARAWLPADGVPTRPAIPR
jgi:CubicO group peptidase (beta-lactamase class C family)